MSVSCFTAKDLAMLEQLHPSLRVVVKAAREVTEFVILETVRGRRAQTVAFRTGKSKVKFGASGHNFVPALAVDLFPAPYDWHNKSSFVELAKIVLVLAQDYGVKLRWGGDWNGDGDIADGWDFPHFELLGWKLIAQLECRLAE